MDDIHKVKPLPYAYDALDGISEKVNTWHHDTHYAGYVKKRNEIETKLETVDRSQANANYSEYGELKRRETFNASGQILHELFWDMMGGKGQVSTSASVVSKLAKDFGSFEKWKEDFIACAKASLGWAILCFDPSDNRLHNYLCDFHNNGAVWGAIQLLAVDVFEHSYYFDYGPERGKFIETFLRNVDWKKVNSLYERIQK